MEHLGIHIEYTLGVAPSQDASHHQDPMQTFNSDWHSGMCFISSKSSVIFVDSGEVHRLLGQLEYIFARSYAS